MNHVRSTNAAKADTPWFREHREVFRFHRISHREWKRPLDHGIRWVVQPMITAAEA